MLPMRAAPAVCELDGPTITGPIISKILIMETPSFLVFSGKSISYPLPKSELNSPVHVATIE